MTHAQRLDAHQEFLELLKENQNFPLDYAALLFAKEAFSSMEPQTYLNRIDALATELSSYIDPTDRPERQLESIILFFFEREGFHGNEERYYEPDNSYLNCVIDRKKGIPITLSVLLIEVLGRLNIEAHGIGMPGHFLVRIDIDDQQFMIDAFRGGVLLTTDDCRRLVQGIFGREMTFHPEMLQPITKRSILYRMLNNLKIIALQQERLAMAYTIMEKMLAVQPDAAIEHRDVALASYQLGFRYRALHHLEHYLNAGFKDPNMELLLNLRQNLTRRISN